MYSYSLTQWVLFFFWYCFLGWVWECFYVSLKYTWEKKKWTFINRGFLHGPLIPIYGFAAITILLATIQLRENTLEVYLIGALTATLYELVTGTVMEKIFKVKYWDYSDLPLNYHGHICLFVSLFWGVLSILLVKIIHVPIENILLQIPSFPCEIVAFSLMVVLGYDFRTSFSEAMDLKEILHSLTENNNTIKHLEHRFNAMVAFSPLLDKNDLLELKLTANERITYNIEKLHRHYKDRIIRLKELVLLPEFDELPDRIEVFAKLDACRRTLIEKNNKMYLRALNQLKRNPIVKSVKYQEAMELLHDLIKKKD